MAGVISVLIFLDSGGRRNDKSELNHLFPTGLRNPSAALR